MGYEQFRRQVKPAAVPFDITILRLRLYAQAEERCTAFFAAIICDWVCNLGVAPETVAVFPRLAPDAGDAEPGQPRVIEVPTLLAPSEIGA